MRCRPLGASTKFRVELVPSSQSTWNCKVHDESAAVDVHQRSTFGLVLSQSLFGPNSGLVQGASVKVGALNLLPTDARPRLAAAGALGTLILAATVINAITNSRLARDVRLYIVPLLRPRPNCSARSVALTPCA
jgi:hypothetical protein